MPFVREVDLKKIKQHIACSNSSGKNVILQNEKVAGFTEKHTLALQASVLSVYY